ncbi:MAG: TonB-dependent receptor [Pseudohongiellaceae bacterium]
MHNTSHFRPYRRKLLCSSIVAALAIPLSAHAQDEDREIEELVVTGSYIRNSSFNGASPVDTLEQEAVLNSGSINMGQFMRDLVYTANTDAVSNVLGGPGGGQDGNSAGFNLRGLGPSSTLTLFDGSRTVNSEEVVSIVPSIALSRMEVVLDGGAALYGSDAVAGVVNIIPIKEYDGIRTRTFYSRDDGGDFEEYKASMLWGRSWNNVNTVLAVEGSKNTPLKRGERSRYLRFDNDLFQDGPGGTYSSLETGDVLIDPSCGTFNEGNEDKGKNGNHPSGRPTTVNGGKCIFNYGQWIQYNRPQEEISVYSSTTYQATDWLELEAQVVFDHRVSTFITEPMSPVSSAWKPQVIMPANHPANPIGEALIPVSLRLFSGFDQGPKPSYVKNGSQWDESTYYTDRYKFGGRYDIGGSWTGETWFTHQQRRWSLKSYEGLADHVIAGLQGQGGPNGDQWYNPLLSSDPRSPYYEEGVTSNTQEVVDWLFAKGDRIRSRNRLMTFDSFVTGELWDFPAGPVQMAYGVHIRDSRAISKPDRPASLGNNISTSSGAGGPATIAPNSVDDSLVRSTFMELEIPILHNLSMQAAARYEKFEDIDLRTTTPKVAFRYEPFSNLAIRASWGEGFLAPAANQIGPIRLTNCGIERDGADPITGITLLGVESCVSTNPNLGEEQSVIKNVGFTWEPLDGLSLGLDYQEIDFDGRIVSPDSIDIVNEQFQRMLAATGRSPASYDPTPGSADRQAAEAWLDANPNPLLVRSPTTYGPTLFIEVPENVESVNVKVFDLNARYTWTSSNYGQFTFGLVGSYIDEYLLTTLDGIIDVNGLQNGETGKAPPLPKLKYNGSVDWFMGQHSARFVARYVDDVGFTDRAPITPITPGVVDSVERPTNVRHSWQVDTNYSYAMDSLFGFGQDVILGVGINNLFDWQPQRLPIPGGFETRLYDPFGRTLSFSMEVSL